LQNLIIEQETSGKTLEVAKALEASFKQQAVQVFIEGLGPLKDLLRLGIQQPLKKPYRRPERKNGLVPTPNIQEEIYLIPAQTLDESILCSNTVNQVRQKQILIAAVNLTEKSIQPTKEQIKGLNSENFTEVKVQTIQKRT